MPSRATLLAASSPVETTARIAQTQYGWGGVELSSAMRATYASILSPDACSEMLGPNAAVFFCAPATMTPPVPSLASATASSSPLPPALIAQ